MLSREEWSIQKIHDLYSLESLVAWLEKQPGGNYYEFCDPSICATAQYLRFYGVEEYRLSLSQLRLVGWLEIVGGQPRTFGAALERARAAERSLHG